MVDLLDFSVFWKDRNKYRAQGDPSEEVTGSTSGIVFYRRKPPRHMSMDNIILSKKHKDLWGSMAFGPNSNYERVIERQHASTCLQYFFGHANTLMLPSLRTKNMWFSYNVNYRRFNENDVELVFNRMKKARLIDKRSYRVGKDVFFPMGNLTSNQMFAIICIFRYMNEYYSFTRYLLDILRDYPDANFATALAFVYYTNPSATALYHSFLPSPATFFNHPRAVLTMSYAIYKYLINGPSEGKPFWPTLQGNTESAYYVSTYVLSEDKIDKKYYKDIQTFLTFSPGGKKYA